MRRLLSPSSLAVCAIFFCALALRLAGLTWGLPNAGQWYSYHPDESLHQIAGSVIGMVVSGDANPHFFNYPSISIYLTALAYTIASGLGLCAPPAAPFPWNTLHDVILSGRVVTVLLGAATVFPTYGFGRTLAGHRVGLCAALLLALLPGHVQHSHFATVDVPATFFVALCLWLSMRALEADKPHRWLYGAALAAGLAAATKYNAGLVLVAPLTVIVMRRSEARSRGLIPACIGVSLVGFVIGCPYALLSFREFLGSGDQGFLYELLRHPREGSGDIFTNTGNGWVYHLIVNAPFLLTWPVLALALLGLAAFRRAPQPRVGIVLLAWLVAGFLPLGLSQVRFMRYLLPLGPALCVFAAWGAAWLGALVADKVPALNTSVRYSRMTVAALLGLCVALGAGDALRPMLTADSRDKAVAALGATPLQNVTVGLLGSPWFYTPPLQPRGDNVAVAASSDGRYRFAYTGLNAAALQSEKPAYFIISQYEWMEKERLNDPAYRAWQAELGHKYRLVGDFKTPPLWGGSAGYVPHDYLYTNPEIRIYRRNF